MDWLNYHHLYYFYLSVQEGGISAAARRLRLSQPTVSAQIRSLESNLGGKLYERVGRGLQLTELGQLVYRHANEIFTLGNELKQAVRGDTVAGRLRFRVGITDALPKLLVHELLKPALEAAPSVHLDCKEDHVGSLLAELAIHSLDLVLADTPIAPNTSVKAYNHPLGESGITIFAAPKLAKKLQSGFPKSLHGAPFLMPGLDSVMHGSLEQWFERVGVQPAVAATLGDSALLKAFGQGGLGAFAAPSVVEESVCRQYGVRAMGRADGLSERIYAISVERRVKHPCVMAIANSARDLLSR
ncbi:MAG TPA: LysR family transcriptional regulator [Polyangiaceae bacterium]|nr:LysR family transcriptional regulator [Polyangiaceae bacterium]